MLFPDRGMISINNFLTTPGFFRNDRVMKQRSILTAAVFASCLLVLTVVAGPEPLPSGKEMKQVAPLPPPPPECSWTGFYLGIHGGGEFGHSETADFVTGRSFGYHESGFNGGGQFGYNWQWHCLVLGPEFDFGYMNLDGKGSEHPFTGVHGETDSDFYTTLRGRIGMTLDWHGCWLVYGTGGAIGLDYTTRFHVDPDFFDARRSDFDWGYTLGGGVERMLTRHWSVKTEYLYFSLDDQSFSNTQSGITGHFNAETTGHIVRAGLNYKF
jgi:outer membrane immunogenic protein